MFKKNIGFHIYMIILRFAYDLQFPQFNQWKLECFSRNISVISIFQIFSLCLLSKHTNKKTWFISLHVKMVQRKRFLWKYRKYLGSKKPTYNPFHRRRWFFLRYLLLFLNVPNSEHLHLILTSCFIWLFEYYSVPDFFPAHHSDIV